MTKDDLVRAVQDSLDRTPCANFGKDDIKTVIEHTLAGMAAAIADGENIYLRGFGTFAVKTAKAKTARNISQGTAILIPARQVVKFKPSRALAVGQK